MDGTKRRSDESEYHGLWEARKEVVLSDDQLERVRSLMIARQKASLWENFSRMWQGVPTQGAQKTRKSLGLDERPIVLLATNVLGDSLTLGGRYLLKAWQIGLKERCNILLPVRMCNLLSEFIRVKSLTRGLSMVDVIDRLLPELPEHIHLIKPKDKVNTYDIVEITEIGLVYTTTVGMEMAMSGIPAIVVGNTHYRGRGFTFDRNPTLIITNY